jgi:hypothetical protein
MSPVIPVRYIAKTKLFATLKHIHAEFPQIRWNSPQWQVVLSVKENCCVGLVGPLCFVTPIR